MSAPEATVQSGVSAQVVDQEFEKLQRFHIDCRRIVLVDDEDPPEGGFGIVQRAELHQSAYLPVWLASRRYGPPQLVAVKQIKLTKIFNKTRAKRAFTREMLVWSSLDAHPGIAKFLGFYADFQNSKAWLLSPWEPNGNVSEFVKAQPRSSRKAIAGASSEGRHDCHASSLTTPSQIYDTIDALTFLHQRNQPVCHGDIKAANVLVGADFKARLCDFGLARLHEDSGLGRLETSSGMKGSIRWCSPEVLNGAQREPSSDVYSWAWLVWEMMTGKVPYEETTVDFVIMRQIFESLLPQVDGEFRLGGCLQLWELMTRCWNGKPLERPTAKMCKTTVTYLPRCTPTMANADHPIRSAALLENLGDLESWKGNQEKSSQYLDEAMRLYQEEVDTKGIANVLRKQAAAAHRISDFNKLRTIATTALEHCRALNDALGIAEASYYLGHSIWMLNLADDPLPILRESLEIRRAHGDDIGVVECLERVAGIQKANGQKHEALSTLDEAMAIATRSGDQLGRANALHMMGRTHIALSDFPKATEAFSEAITITRNVGWDGELSTNLRSMGYLKVRLGEYCEAEERFQESISIARRIGSWYNLTRGLTELVECLRIQSKLSEAVPLLEEACLSYHGSSDQGEWNPIASTLVELQSSQGNWDRALFWQDHIISRCRSQKDHGEVAYYLQQKGQTLVDAQRYDEAALHFEAYILVAIENGYLWSWKLEQLCAVPKTAMKWERRLPLQCDLKKLQRRQPQLKTATLKLPIALNSGAT